MNGHEKDIIIRLAIFLEESSPCSHMWGVFLHNTSAQEGSTALEDKFLIFHGHGRDRSAWEVFNEAWCIEKMDSFPSIQRTLFTNQQRTQQALYVHFLHTKRVISSLLSMLRYWPLFHHCVLKYASVLHPFFPFGILVFLLKNAFMSSREPLPIVCSH